MATYKFDLGAGAPDLEFRLGALRQPGSEAWTKHSDRLARQLSEPEWDAVERAYELYDGLISAILATRAPSSDKELERTREQIDDALNRLT
jgi:hypothetical protein